MFAFYYVGNSASAYFAVFLGRKIKKKRRNKKRCVQLGNKLLEIFEIPT